MAEGLACSVEQTGSRSGRRAEYVPTLVTFGAWLQDRACLRRVCRTAPQLLPRSPEGAVLQISRDADATLAKKYPWINGINPVMLCAQLHKPASGNGSERDPDNAVRPQARTCEERAWSGSSTGHAARRMMMTCLD